MSKKLRLLMCAESSNIKSGFGLYTREILSRLYDSNLFEIAELSSYHTVESPKNFPWKIYPNAINPNHKDYQKYKNNAINAFGLWRFDKTVLDFKPDIVFDIRDFWMFSYQEISPLRPYFNWVIAPTVDSLPQKNEWMMTFANADLVLAHTDWAISYLNNAQMNINTGSAVPDSVDINNFAPLSYSKKYHKSKFLLPPDSFIIGSVMRNQKRKLIPNLMNSLQKLIQFTGNKDIYLYLHTSYPENSGWSLPELIQEYNLHNNILFTYYCNSCKKPHASLYQGLHKQCPMCKQSICQFPNVNAGLSDTQMAEIYNLFDFYVQYAICEGLGIPQLEAAACGIPVCSVDYSAMSEVTSNLEAFKVSYALFRELETNAMRALPNDSHLVQIIYEYMKLPLSEKETISHKMRNNIIKHYSWDKTAEKLIEQLTVLKPKNLWDRPLETNHTINVPKNLSNKDFVRFIIFEVIKSPHIWKSHFIQEMIKNLDYGFANQGTVIKYDRSVAIKQLEQYLTNKIHIEKIRSNEIKLTDDFLSYA
jgi:glycosyltransferase involved in cell wall biosynthesis